METREGNVAKKPGLWTARTNLVPGEVSPRATMWVSSLSGEGGSGGQPVITNGKSISCSRARCWGNGGRTNTSETKNLPFSAGRPRLGDTQREESFYCNLEFSLVFEELGGIRRGKNIETTYQNWESSWTPVREKMREIHELAICETLGVDKGFITVLS